MSISFMFSLLINSVTVFSKDFKKLSADFSSYKSPRYSNLNENSPLILESSAEIFALASGTSMVSAKISFPQKLIFLNISP